MTNYPLALCLLGLANILMLGIVISILADIRQTSADIRRIADSLDTLKSIYRESQYAH